MNGPKVNKLAGLAGLARTAPLRREVFIDEQQVPEALEWDDDDLVALHYIVCRAGDQQPVAVARVVDLGDRRAKVQRVAVLRELRGAGLGRALMLQIIADSASAGVTELLLDAQTHAVGFYRALGFTAHGTPFLDAGIPHVHMTRHNGDLG